MSSTYLRCLVCGLQIRPLFSLAKFSGCGLLFTFLLCACRWALQRLFLRLSFASSSASRLCQVWFSASGIFSWLRHVRLLIENWRRQLLQSSKEKTTEFIAALRRGLRLFSNTSSANIRNTEKEVVSLGSKRISKFAIFPSNGWRGSLTYINLRCVKVYLRGFQACQSATSSEVSLFHL